MWRQWDAEADVAGTQVVLIPQPLLLLCHLKPLYHVLAKEECQHSLEGLSSELLAPISLCTRVPLFAFKIRLLWLNTPFRVLLFSRVPVCGLVHPGLDMYPIHPSQRLVIGQCLMNCLFQKSLLTPRHVLLGQCILLYRDFCTRPLMSRESHLNRYEIVC